MCKVLRIAVATATIGIATLSLTVSAQAGNGSAVGAGLVGFGVGAILGSALAPQTVYVAPPPRRFIMCRHRRRSITERWSMDLPIGTVITDTVTVNQPRWARS